MGLKERVTFSSKNSCFKMVIASSSLIGGAGKSQRTEVANMQKRMLLVLLACCALQFSVTSSQGTDSTAAAREGRFRFPTATTGASERANGGVADIVRSQFRDHQVRRHCKIFDGRGCAAPFRKYLEQKSLEILGRRLSFPRHQSGKRIMN